MKRNFGVITVICLLLAGCASQATDIGEMKAKESALARVSGAAESDIRGFKKDYDDGKVFYEGKIILGNTEYEFEIDASDGDVVSWEKDMVND